MITEHGKHHSNTTLNYRGWEFVNRILKKSLQNNTQLRQVKYEDS
jgi:hypothetical protein